MWAAYNGHADAMCALLIAGATEGIKNNFGYGVATKQGRASRGTPHRPMRRAA
jgi:ankyrin repeat protein